MIDNKILNKIDNVTNNKIDNETDNTYDCDLDVILDAGKTLMESGAEIYRIEDTLKRMANALKIKHFDAYVVNGGIFASGTNCKGVKEARVVNIPKQNIHLAKLEAVNSLSRYTQEHANVTTRELCEKLKAIKSMPDSPFWTIMLSYFVGAGCFSYAVGSSIIDALFSAISGLIMGLVLHKIEKYIHTNVLITIIGSVIVALTANVFHFFGMTNHRGLVILGTLMLLVPGSAFVNSVREFSQNNYTTGVSLLMSALLTCVSIAAGVAVTTEIIPFADQMNSIFTLRTEGFFELLLRTILAGIGTIAFAHLFHTPQKYFVDLGFLSAATWMTYLYILMVSDKEAAAIFIPTLMVALCSRTLSIKRKCPTTIYLSTSIFPLLPGLSFYRAIYFIMIGNNTTSYSYMRSSFISAFSIAIAIAIIQQIPSRALARIANFHVVPS